MSAQAQTNNHRWSPRLSRHYEVMIYGDGNPFPARLRDISIGGLYVEADPAKLAPNALVHVVFRLDSESEANMHRLPANVIWMDDGGAGLMFSDYRPEALRALRRLIGEMPDE